MLTMLLAGGHMATAMLTTTADTWLPVSSATLLFANKGVAWALLIGSGLAARATALLNVGMIGYHEMSGVEGSVPVYLTGLLLRFVVMGPGAVFLHCVLVARLPQ